eukprot:3804526-Pyramimonas_sp.AAC.1
MHRLFRYLAHALVAAKPPLPAAAVRAKEAARAAVEIARIAAVGSLCADACTAQIARMPPATLVAELQLVLVQLGP